MESQLIFSAVAEYRKPILIKPLQDTQSPKNAPLEFACVITADPLPDIVWLKDGKVLTESLDVQFKQTVKDLQWGLKEIKYALYFPAGRHCDTGNYTIQAKNKFGAVESSAHLDILLKPEIEGFKDQISVPFKSIVFEVDIHANPKPKVTWTKGKVNCCNIDNCQVIADVEKEHYTLCVENIGLEDDGVYTITASNSVGDTIATAKLVCHTEKPHFIKMPQDATIHDFAEYQTKVRAEGIPIPALHWIKDGKAMKLDDEGVLCTMETASELQVTADLSIAHFAKKFEGNVSGGEPGRCRRRIGNVVFVFCSMPSLRQILPERPPPNSNWHSCKRHPNLCEHWNGRLRSIKARNWN